jgi:hypothetical protein
VRVHITSETDAITGVINEGDRQMGCPLGVSWYASETFGWDLAEEIRNSEHPVYVYNLGDHPSGVDAWRDSPVRPASMVARSK